MNGMPTWWLVISGLAYLSLFLVCVSLIVVAVFAVKFLKEVAPKVVAIEGQVQDLVKKVQALTESLHDTVSSVGGRAKGVVGSAEGIAQSASRQFERFSPFVIGALTAIRLVKALNESKKGRSLAKTTTRKGIAKKPAGLLGRVVNFVRR